MWNKIKLYIKHGNNDLINEIKYEISFQDKINKEEIFKKLIKLERSYNLKKFKIKSENFISECCKSLGDQSAAAPYLFWPVQTTFSVEYHASSKSALPQYKQNNYLDIKEMLTRIIEIKQIIKHNTSDMLNIQEKKNVYRY